MKKLFPWIVAGLLLTLGVATVLMWESVMMVYREHQLEDPRIDWETKKEIAGDLMDRYTAVGAPIERAVDQLGVPYQVFIEQPEPPPIEFYEEIPPTRAEFLEWFHELQKEHPELIVIWSHYGLAYGTEFRDGVAFSDLED